MGLLRAISNLWRGTENQDRYAQTGRKTMIENTNQLVAQGCKTRVRHFNREDVDKWLAWSQQPDPLYSSSYPRQMNRYERDAWFYERTNRTDYYMFAVDNFEGQLVGLITLRNIDKFRIQAVLGITLRPESLGGGYGTDSLWAFLHYFFDVMRFDVMLLDVAAYNRRAQRVYEKCGFVYTGEHWGYFEDYSVFVNDHYRGVRQYFRKQGAWVETLFYDMLIRRQDFNERRRLGLDPQIKH
jgi:RimJ/RimL family protein N-acetyltransferase